VAPNGRSQAWLGRYPVVPFSGRPSAFFGSAVSATRMFHSPNLSEQVATGWLPEPTGISSKLAALRTLSVVVQDYVVI